MMFNVAFGHLFNIGMTSDVCEYDDENNRHNIYLTGKVKTEYIHFMYTQGFKVYLR